MNKVFFLSNYILTLKKFSKLISLFFCMALSPLSWSQTCAPTSIITTLSAGTVVTLSASPANKTVSNTVYPAGNVLAVTESRVVPEVIFSNADQATSVCRFWKTYVEAPSGAVAVSGLSYEGTQVFKTKIPGIGYAARVSDNSNGATYYPIPATGRTTVYTDPKGQANATLWKPGFKFEVTFISTGEPIPVGTHTINDVIGVVSAENKKGEFLAGAKAQIKANPTFVVPALSCTVDYGSQLALTLPTVSINNVSQWAIGVNNVESPESNVGSAKITCPAGIALYGTFVDINNKSNVSNILSVEKSVGAAQGVGIALWRQQGSAGTANWRQVAYGPDSSAAGNTNQWRLAAVQPGLSYTILNIKAQYVRTAQSTTAGTVNARAVVVFSYQ